MEEASPTDGKKRRSFLPAPKKFGQGVSPTSPQQPTSQIVPPQQPAPSLSSSITSLSSSSSSLNPLPRSTYSDTVGSSVDDLRDTTRSKSADSRKSDQKNEAPVFGKGLRVGARVKIGGIKPGILRYLGTTHLAPGIFCGIELFEPDGNHDGKVNGHRYFTCAPNYGIFAPKEKVCLDPAYDVNRLSDSDGAYSSSESLTERTYKAYKDFAEPDIEAIDYSTLSPESSFHEALLKGEEAAKKHYRHLKAYAQAKLSQTFTVPDSDQSIADSSYDSQDSQRRSRSGLPKPARSSNLPTLSYSSPTSRLPTFPSRSYTKVDGGIQDPDQGRPKSAVYSSQTTELQYQAQPKQSEIRSLDSTFVLESGPVVQELEQSPLKYRPATTRSSDDSEEDGTAVRETTLSTGIKKQLRADSRQYLNFTFDQEEATKSLDYSSGSDTNLKEKAVRDSSSYVLNKDPHFARGVYSRDESSVDALSTVPPGYVQANITYSSHDSEFDKGVLPQVPSDHDWLTSEERRLTSTPVSGRRLRPDGSVVQSDSYTVVSREGQQDYLVRGSWSHSGSEFEDGVGGHFMETTRSISDSELPPHVTPSLDSLHGEGSTDSQAFPQVYQSAVDGGAGYGLQEGGYVGDGSNVGLTLSRTLESSGKSASSLAEGHGAEASQSRNYIICSGEVPHDDSSSIKKDSPRGAVVASQSYTLVKSDSAASSPSRKFRKVSSGSSCETSSSGTEPKTDNSDHKGEGQDDSSSGPSPEVSQALEWDYGQEFDGKIPPLGQQDNTMTTSASTGTSDSLSDVLRDVSETSDAIESENPSLVMDDSDSQFETPENDFESIDNLEDFPIFGKDVKTIMTDSGISDFEMSSAKSSCSTVCGNSSDDCSREDDPSSQRTAMAISSDSSQETLAVADTPGSVEEKDLPCDDEVPYRKPLTSNALDVELDSRLRKDSIEEGNNSASPASVVSVEDVDSSLHDTTIVGDVVPEHQTEVQTVVHASGVRRKEGEESTRTVKTRPESGIEDSEIEDAPSSPEPTTVIDGPDGDRHGNKKERPISLLSTTSADTGYAPDTDSEMGTLTTNSPCDWTDRIGLEHPPFDSAIPEDTTLGTETDLKAPVCPDQPVVPEAQLRVKSSDEDDVSVDTTSQAEDDRIEADQLNGPDLTAEEVKGLEVKVCSEGEGHVAGKPSPGKDETMSIENQNKDTGDGEGALDKTVELGESHDSKDKDASTRTSHKGKKGDSKVSSVEPDTHQEKKVNPKKAFKMTKKKMEVIDHKLPNIKVASRLADYIHTPPPPPPKPKEDEENKKKKAGNNKNNKNFSKKKRDSVVDGEINKDKTTGKEESVEKETPAKEKEKPEKIEKPKPVIKRTPPKSKWGNIMSQIEISKEKPKPKPEVKSSLAAYLAAPVGGQHTTSDPNDPVAVNNAKNEEQNQKVIKREPKPSRIKPLPPPPPKIDLSKIKSKLNVPTAASASKVLPKRDQSPSNTKSNKHVGPHGKVSRSHSPATSVSKASASDILLVQQTGSGVSSVRSSHTDLSVTGTHDDTEDGVPSKRGSVDLNKKSRRLSNHSIKSEQVEKVKKNKELTRRRSEVKSTIPPFNLSKRSIKANGTVRGNGVVPSSTPNHKASPGTGGSTTTNTSQKEIHRLESLCEARTKELTQTKMQLKATAQAFDAMSVVVNYCCAELNAFECPQLAQKLDTVQKQLTDCLSQIAELTSQKETLDQSLTQITQEKAAATLQAEEAATKAETEREDHQRVQKELEDTHNAALTTQRDELTSKHTEVVKKLHERHDREIELQKQSFDRQVLDVQNEHKMEINGIRISHLEEIQELRNKHDKQMEELHKQHRNKLEDITHRFESIKVTLSEKVESLRGECDDLRHRARSSEDALQRDADVKVQMALAPYLALPKEIESLRTVVEMRNEEIQRLRSKNMDLEKQLEEIPIAREKIISLQQKVENLEAIINIKTDHEKQLHEKCQVLMKKYDRESRANKRLSMDYEQVMWRMSQSQEFGSSESLSKRQVSRSPPRSETNSPDPRRRALSPNDPMSMSGEVVMRAKKRSSHSASEGERKLRSRSATFVVEKNGGTIGDAASESRSPSASPLPKPKRWKRPLSQPNGGSGNGGDEESSEQSSDNLDAGKNGEDRMVQSDYSNNANDELLNETFDSQPEMLSSTGEMIHSYARSISAVSDSGVYDSLTRSEMLNSSIISTDSEWAVASTTSANVSLNFDLTADDLNAIHESKGENTVLDTSTATTTPTAETSTAESVTICVESGSPSKEKASVKVTGNVPENFVSQETQNTYQFQVSLPSGDGDTSLDNVFEEDEEREHEEVSLDSCTFSMEYTDGASASNSRLTSVSEDSNLQDDKEEVLDGEAVNKSNTE